MLPILGTDGLETNVESETGLIDMDDTTHNSPGGPGYIPTLPVGGAGGKTVELSNSDLCCRGDYTHPDLGTLASGSVPGSSSY